VTIAEQDEFGAPALKEFGVVLVSFVNMVYSRARYKTQSGTCVPTCTARELLSGQTKKLFAYPAG
jgi:hypothetical protein